MSINLRLVTTQSMIIIETCFLVLSATGFVFRMGAEYAFEVGNWEIAPQLSIDFVDGEQLGVIGVALAKGF